MGVCNPVMVEVTRGGVVESRHRGAAVVVGAGGGQVASWGDVDRPMFPRSAVKPFQALPLLESGAADHFQLSEEEIALACGSHGGEFEHVHTVAGWLCRIGLTPEDLACGAHPPLSEAAAVALVRKGEAPSALHNNCSGKHAGFLTTALHLGEPVTGYAGPVHPVQLRVKMVLAQISGADLGERMRGIDGCGAPAFAMPLRNLALAMARLADPGHLNRLRAAAIRRIVRAMTGQPYFVAGRGRFDTAIIHAGAGDVVVKSGAEGVHAAALPRRGLGIAVKIDDGGKRAAEAAVAALLERYGDLDEGCRRLLAAHLEVPVRGATAARLGTVRVAAGWLR